jgi:hypothetical protein
MEVECCPECGVPAIFNERQVWLNNGDIVAAPEKENRLGFIECENLDPLFKKIEEIIGISIEPLIMNITARGVERYTVNLMPDEIREMVRNKQLDPGTLAGPILEYCHILGYGRYEFVDSRYQRDDDDYSIIRIEAPFSVPEAAGSIAGVIAGMTGGESEVTYKEISPGLYEFVTRWTEYPDILKEKMKTEPYIHRDGDLELERCASCGAPAGLSAFRWDFDRGLILSKHTGRRMAILGPELLDVLFDALEEELGEAIPAAVVEAQRRFVKTGFYTIDEISDEGDFRTQLALRGMGNLRELTMGSQGIRMRIDNAAGYLLTVGMVQGLFDLAFDLDSIVEWELTEEGDLEMEVKPKRGQAWTLDI